MQLKTGFAKKLIITCRNADGGVAWREVIHNLTPNEGLNNFLSLIWKLTTQPANWYILLVNNVGFSAFAATDTAAQIGGSNGWTEFTGYSQSTRVVVTFGSVASQSVNNSGSPSVFTINTNGTLQGAAIATASAKGATSGFIGGEGAFASPQAVVNGQTVMVEVVATAASA